MSVISRNPFDLLGDSEDSNQIPVSQPVVKKQQPVRETKPKDTTRAIPGENKRSDYPKRGGMATRGAARSGPRDNSNFEVAPREDVRPSSARGSIRGGRGGARSGDRKPHSFHKDSEKKDLAGKGSWGEPVEAQTAALGDDADVAVPTTAVEEEAAEEPEIQTKTLEQYLAERESAPVAATSARQANEGADDSQWKDAVVLKKNDQEDFLLITKNQKSNNSSKAKAAKAEKQFVEIEQRFSDNGRSARGGSDRGNGRGSRGGNRGGDRGGRGARGGAQKVNVTDERSFPALK